MTGVRKVKTLCWGQGSLQSQGCQKTGRALLHSDYFLRRFQTLKIRAVQKFAQLVNYVLPDVDFGIL